MWAVDMDFERPAPPANAVRARAEHPVFGYARLPAWPQWGRGYMRLKPVSLRKAINESLIRLEKAVVRRLAPACA